MPSSSFGPEGFASARSSESASADCMAIIENRPYFPFLTVDPSDTSSTIQAAKSIVDAYYNFNCTSNVSSTSGAGEHMNITSVRHRHTVSDGDARVAAVPGGLTNALFKIDFPSLSQDGGRSSFLIRLFGAEGMIDRDAETTTFARLTAADSKVRVAHPSLEYIGRFANGRIEAWMPNMRQAALSDLRSPSIYNSVARQLARLHCRFPIPSYLYEKECSLVDGRTQMVNFLNVVLEWIGTLEGMTMALDRQKIALVYLSVVGKEYNLNCGENKDADTDTHTHTDTDTAVQSMRQEIVSYLKGETTWLQSTVPQRHPRAAVAFAHNDLWTQNILLQAESDDSDKDAEVCIIDYEWGMVNYAMYDVANFFCEMCGGNEDGVPNVDLFPARECQEEFLREYLKEKRILDIATSQSETGRDCKESEDESISELLSQIELFRLASNLIRGVLAILQACGEILQAGPSFCAEDARLRLDGQIGLDSLDKLRYGKNRLRNYLVCKNALVE